jgi:NAD(P)-dependent dehydrogenase (short-subunit alcohol dehydrogenase family)
MKTKSFLITGAASYVGRSLIEMLKNEPEVKLLITTRKKYPEFQELYSDRIMYLPFTDLLNSEDLKKLSDGAAGFFSDVFHIINCVGGYWDHMPMSKVSHEESVKVINENFMTVFNTAYYLLPLLKTRKEENDKSLSDENFDWPNTHFVTFGCNSTRYYYPWMVPYTAAKQAVATLTKSLRSEYSAWNFQFNCFILATVNTEREKKFKPFGDHEHWLKPEKIAEVVLEVVRGETSLINGSEIELFDHSPHYHTTSYFGRIRK